MKSEEWTLGGTTRDWNGSVELMRDETPDFVEFDELIEQVCPNISFIQYKNVYRNVLFRRPERIMTITVAMKKKHGGNVI